MGQSADGAQLGAELLATLPSDNGLLSKAGQAHVSHSPGEDKGLLLHLPVAQPMEDGELFAAFRPEAQLSVASETTFGHLLRSYRTSQAVVTDDGQHAVIDGNNSLIIVDSTGDVRRLELSLAEGETLETSSLAASDSSFWITSRIDEISGATQQLIWRSAMMINLSRPTPSFLGKESNNSMNRAG